MCSFMTIVTVWEIKRTEIEQVPGAIKQVSPPLFHPEYYGSVWKLDFNFKRRIITSFYYAEVACQFCGAYITLGIENLGKIKTSCFQKQFEGVLTLQF